MSRANAGSRPVDQMLRSTAPARQEPKGADGGRADAIGASIYVEENPVGLASGDEVAAAMGARTAVRVMLFDVVADLLPTIQDAIVWTQKKIIRDHLRPYTTCV